MLKSARSVCIYAAVNLLSILPFFGMNQIPVFERSSRIRIDNLLNPAPTNDPVTGFPNCGVCGLAFGCTSRHKPAVQNACTDWGHRDIGRAEATLQGREADIRFCAQCAERYAQSVHSKCFCGHWSLWVNEFVRDVCPVCSPAGAAADAARRAEHNARFRNVVAQGVNAALAKAMKRSRKK